MSKTGIKKKKKKWIVIVIVVVLLIGAIGVWVKSGAEQIEVASNLIEMVPAQKRDLSDTISIKGTVTGESTTNVTSIASAEILAVNVQVGDQVQEGDLLALLDEENIEDRMASLETDIRNADANANNQNNLTKQNLDYAVADQEETLRKYKDAIADAQEEYDEAKDRVWACNDVIYAIEMGWEQDLDKSIYEAKLKGYEEQLEAAQKALDAAVVNYNDAVESARRSVASAQNAVDMIPYQSDSSKSLADQKTELKEQLEDCEVYAPCSGVVTAVDVSVGDQYTAGMKMVTIEKTDSLKVSVSISEADILKIQEGMKAIITSEATGDKEIEGTVTRVVRVKNQSTNAADAGAGGYSAEITIDDSQLLIGMSVKARIILQEKKNVFAVPYDLIQYDEEGNAFVLVGEMNEDGTATAVRRDIAVGDEVDYYTEVLGGDLKENEMLIYDVTFSIAEGDIFTPMQQ